MKKLSKETCELMLKLKEAVKEEGGECIISIRKGKYLSQVLYGSPKNVIALLCCVVDHVAEDTGIKPFSILIKMTDAILNVERVD